MIDRTMQWLVCPTNLPLIRRRCLRCPSARYQPHGKFRINANHKLLDVWLLALCAGCGETIKLTVLERANVRTIDPPTLGRFHDNDVDLAAELLIDPGLQRRNNVTLDWTGAWTVHKSGDHAGPPAVVHTRVRFAQPIPLRVTTLLAAGLEVSRSEIQRRIADGTLSSPHRLTGRTSTDFSFTSRGPGRIPAAAMTENPLPERNPSMLGSVAPRVWRREGNGENI
ncbi:hypothetical protein Aab01nite_78670 [Paractinoplanes abujensis]|uniref:DUF1062 domain-containing protein n=1 Tax=Paractinoplanes abujensis TaxID=882441 RepID=A0A7W7FZN0_9ACTN|nr:DUF1062 domain-containing protein [Actinoplanes abujensis]MBB4692243.1 hypothetical protein [Actinoplanes abujensis]GID24277.1 hypothetical protein Aab01nite_78670 [Actinoplanes abujensis]